ncbi:MAG: hypothetical protein FD170_3007 [Bacteroidetes bacterium]|nr:MAG: hypothetical protein FD170_3007 [Bacteroidota bacterium]
MGRQINFFLHPDDQNDFNSFLKSFDDICFLSYYHKTENPTIIDDTLIRDHIKEGSRVHLIRKQDLKDIRFHFIEKFNCWLIDNNSSPVLDFDRCITWENYLHRGRLYFQPKFVDNLQWIEKNADFVKWSDFIISKTRRYFKKFKYKYEGSSYEYNAYLSEKAMSLLTDKKAALGLNGDSLTVN